MSGYERYGIKKKTYSEVELPTNPNLPPWVITPKEEKVIFERWRKKAFASCDHLIKAYVECSNSYKNPLEGMKQCAEVNKASQDCVAQYQKQKYLDIERDILIEERIQKRKEQQQKSSQNESQKSS